jgi:hypothetical protein
VPVFWAVSVELCCQVYQLRASIVLFGVAEQQIVGVMSPQAQRWMKTHSFPLNAD